MEKKPTVVHDQEFWWDSQDSEEEMQTQQMRQMKVCFQSEKSVDVHASKHDFLLQEWHEAEVSLGKDGEPLCMAEDTTGQGQRVTLLSEWSLIEEELEADKVFSQHAEIYSRNDSDIMTTKMQDIINKARLDIQAVGKIALQDNNDFQETHISSLGQVKRFSVVKTCHRRPVFPSHGNTINEVSPSPMSMGTCAQPTRNPLV